MATAAEAAAGGAAAPPGPHPMHEAGGPVVGTMQAFLHTMELCLGPAIFMLLMSFAVFCRKPSQTLVSVMQHFAAGIVLSAVATELLPAMSAQAHNGNDKASATLATLVGFFLGVAMMVGVAHFFGEPAEEDDDEEEEVEEREEGSSGSSEASIGGQQAAALLLPSPTRPVHARHRELMVIAQQHGRTGGPLSPGRGGGMHRTVSMRRKTLMETYREAAMESSSPIPIGTLRQQLRQQQRQQQGGSGGGGSSSLSISVPAGGRQQPQQQDQTTNERTALLRKAATTTTPLTTGTSSLGAAAGTSVGSVGSAAGGSPPPAPLAATLSSEAQRKERLAHKYDSDGDEEAGAGSVVGMLQRPRPRRSSSASSSSGGQGPAQGGSSNGGGAVVTIAIPPSSSSLGAGAGGPRVYGAVPWTLVVPVYVDSLMDGLLIGLSAVAGRSAGLVMSVALTIEMGFLGLTFSAGVGKVRPALRNLLVVGAPCMILIGGAIGAIAAAALSKNPILQVGLIAFGVAALLYLVTEELLVEAHEGGEPHKWYVDMMFFLGFIASVLLEQSVQDQEAAKSAQEQAARLAAAVVTAAVGGGGGGGDASK